MEIDSKTIDLKHIFVGRDLYFKVPPYQRNYSWNLTQVEQLWDDINESLSIQREYFMGPFVLLTEGLDPDREIYDIVDGQQRLTTFVILISLISRYAEMFVQEPHKAIFSRWTETAANIEAMRRTKMDARSLLGWDYDGFNYYLSLNKKDRLYFRESILGRELPPNEESEFKIVSNQRIIEKTYRFFACKIRDSFLNDPNGPQKLKAFLKHLSEKLKFLKIEVKSEIDAYLLFEGLNYKGMTLSVADLLKNRILMTCVESDREEVSSIWDEISVIIEDRSKSDFAEFIRTYWNSFHALPLSPVSKKELYAQVKQWINPENARQLVVDLRSLASFYVELTPKDLKYPSSQTPQGSSEAAFLELSHLKFSVCNSLLLYCKRKHESELKQVSERCLNYLFRVITIGGLSVSFAKTAMGGALKILRDGGAIEDALLKLTSSDMPDALFIERLSSGRFTDGSAMRYFLFKLLINETGREFIPLGDRIQLEHILPQEPKPNWETFAVPDGTEVEDWIYSLGNLTLLISGKNAGAGNRPFHEKVVKYQQASSEQPDGTRISMTYKIHEEFESGNSTWTAERIADRGHALAAKAPEIWPL